MKFQNIGIMSPGDMGQAVAVQLKQQGYNVYTALDKRSARTKALAAQAGLSDVGIIEKLTQQCDIVLSIMNPAAALEFATEVAQALRTNRRKLLLVDCNAVAPATTHEIDKTITAAGGDYVDGGIIGSPPRGTTKIWFYVSGPRAGELEQLASAQIIVRTLSTRIGDASAIKMCYAAMTKGTTALVLELLVVAHRLGVGEALELQINESHRAIYDKVIAGLPVVPPKAHRWVPEMREIASTFKAAGMTPRILEGAADIYEFISTTALGKETPENRDKSRGGKDIVIALAKERGSKSA